jgi:hypothetical protein
MDTTILATYDYGYERVTTILVSGEVVWLGLGHSKYLAGLACSRSLCHFAVWSKCPVSAA